MSQAVAISDEMKHDIRKLRDFGLDLLNVEKPTLVTTEAMGLLAEATEAIHKIIDGFEKPLVVDDSACIVRSINDGKEHRPGMSLREHYAGQAMNGCLSNSHVTSQLMMEINNCDTSKTQQIKRDLFHRDVAMNAVQLADCLIARLISTAGQPAAAPGQAGSLSDGG